MRTSVSVTEERLIAASPAAVWSIVSDPAMHERLDPRCRLETASSEGDQVPSEYVLVVQAGALTKVRLRYFIVDAEPNVRWMAEVSRGGKAQGEQRAELSSSGEGTLLRWMVTLWTGRLTRRLTAASCERQLRTWLAAVEREAVLDGS